MDLFVILHYFMCLNWAWNSGRDIYVSYKYLFIILFYLFLCFLYILGLATQILGKKNLSSNLKVPSMMDKWSHTVL
jgi:hypothetical protein